MNNKKHIVNLEYFGDMLQICPKLPNQQFEGLPFEESILTFLRDLSHSGEIKMITDVNVNKLHQPWRSFAVGMYHKKNVDYAYLLWEDFVYQVENKNVKKSNEMYYPRFTKVIINFFMAKDQSILRRNSVNWHYAMDDYMFTMIKTTNSSTTKGKRLKTSAKTTKPAMKKQPANTSMDKGLTVLSKVALTEAEQLKLVIERSNTQTHISYASGSGADAGTGSLPGVPDVPYDSDDEKISWKSSEEDNDDELNVSEEDDTDNDDDENDNDVDKDINDDDADNQDKDDQDAKNPDDDNEQTDSDNNDDDFVHPNFSTHDEEESFDPRVQTPSHVESIDETYENECGVGDLRQWWVGLVGEAMISSDGGGEAMLGSNGGGEEVIDGINKASEWGMGEYLRKHFVMLIMSESMSIPEVIWEKTWRLLAEDVLEIERQKRNNPEYVSYQIPRSKGEIVLNVASSEIAALLLDGGRTTHLGIAAFLIFKLSYEILCVLLQKIGSCLLDSLKTKLINDEAPIVNKTLFEALIERKRTLLQESQPLSTTWKCWPTVEWKLVSTLLHGVSNGEKMDNECKHVDDSPTVIISQDDDNELELALIGCHKDFRSIANSKIICKNEGFTGVEVKYLGGLWVMFVFNDKQVRDRFLKHEGILSWFSSLEPCHDDFVLKERLVWLEIEGVPIRAWNNDTFKSICNKWGEVLFIDDTDSSNRFSILAKNEEEWSVHKSSNAESNNDKEDEVESVGEFFDNDGNETHFNKDEENMVAKDTVYQPTNSDTFELESLIAKNGNYQKQGSSTPKFPPGFTQSDGGDIKRDLNDVCKPVAREDGDETSVHYESKSMQPEDEVTKKHVGVSMIQQVEDTIKFCTALGFNMEGC
ncbi:uncharacterized mitochondrial protein-like protein [Tanacetum coccineum]